MNLYDILVLANSSGVGLLDRKARESKGREKAYLSLDVLGCGFVVDESE